MHAKGLHDLERANFHYFLNLATKPYVKRDWRDHYVNLVLAQTSRVKLLKLQALKANVKLLLNIRQNSLATCFLHWRHIVRLLLKFDSVEIQSI